VRLLSVCRYGLLQQFTETWRKQKCGKVAECAFLVNARVTLVSEMPPWQTHVKKPGERILRSQAHLWDTSSL
jgi:hypothetical protein